MCVEERMTDLTDIERNDSIDSASWHDPALHCRNSLEQSLRFDSYGTADIWRPEHLGPALWYASATSINAILGNIFSPNIFQIISDGCRNRSKTKLKNKALPTQFATTSKCVVKNGFLGAVFSQCTPKMNFPLCMPNLYPTRDGSAMDP